MFITKQREGYSAESMCADGEEIPCREVKKRKCEGNGEWDHGVIILREQESKLRPTDTGKFL